MDEGARELHLRRNAEILERMKLHRLVLDEAEAAYAAAVDETRYACEEDGSDAAYARLNALQKVHLPIVTAARMKYQRAELAEEIR